MAAMRSVGRAIQREDMALRMRRPPEEYVTLLSQNEQEFRSYVDSFERSPLFDRLVRQGAISRVRLQGRIPREKYEEHMDRALVEWMNEHAIAERAGWERDFFAFNALDRVPELAQKYGVSPGPLVKFLRYMRSSARGESEWSHMARSPGLSAALSGPSGDERALESASGESRVDLTEIIETTRDFVTRYKVSEQEFLDLVLGGEATAQELADRFSCSLREAEDVLEAADRVYMVQSYEGVPAPSRMPSAATMAPDTPVAYVEIIDDKPSIQFHQDSVYAQRYHIRLNTVRGQLKQLLKEAVGSGEEGLDDAQLEAAARELLGRARLINQRLSALSRLITTLCAQQVEYLKTGEVRHLKPLAQAELSRQMGEHPSTVSRLIRNKTIETPHGKLPLLFLCQSKTDVVARLIAEFPKLTDQEVVSKLRDEFDCYIARRTVAYHRGKRLRRNKRHKSPQKKDEQGPDALSPDIEATDED
jgi:hypothetical protein